MPEKQMPGLLADDFRRRAPGKNLRGGLQLGLGDGAGASELTQPETGRTNFGGSRTRAWRAGVIC